jgi:Ni,Fe-hydrogenase maturation factor
VVFADADTAGPEPFWIGRIGPTSGAPGFSTHSVAPGAVLALARDLFGAEPEAWLLGIRGYEFDDYGEGLTQGAKANLDEAVRYLGSAVRAGEFREVRAEGASRRTGEQDED